MIAPEDDQATEAWLSELCESSQDDAETERFSISSKLRRTILAQHEFADAQIDEVSLRRTRKRLLESLDRTSATESGSRWRGWYRYSVPIAAVLAAIVLVPTLLQKDIDETAESIPDIQILRGYGNLEIPRGGGATVEVSVADTDTVAEELATALERLEIPFNLMRLDDRRYLLQFAIPATPPSVLTTRMQELGVPDDVSGFLTIRISSE